MRMVKQDGLREALVKETLSAPGTVTVRISRTVAVDRLWRDPAMRERFEQERDYPYKLKGDATDEELIFTGYAARYHREFREWALELLKADTVREAIAAVNSDLADAVALVSDDDVAAVGEAIRAALSDISPLANEAPMDQLQRLGQEFDAANDTGALREEIERLKVENERLTRAVGSGILRDLLTPDESDEFVKFIQFLRGQRNAALSPDDGEGK